MAPASRGSRRRPERISLRHDDNEPHGNGSLFVWTVVILLLIGFALGCWIFSFYVFGHPEKAFSYSILHKLKKMEPLKRFEITGAPRGEFLNPQQLTVRYGEMSDRELARSSEQLLRNYLRNYKLTQDLVPYVVGSYTILDSFELGDQTVFPAGVVALAQAKDMPGILLEHVFAGDKRDVPTLERMLLTGLNLRLDKGMDLSALINVTRLSDGRLQFTAVPLLYGDYMSSTGPGTISLNPPDEVHLAKGFPIVTGPEVADATEKYSSYRTRTGLNAANNPKETAAKSPPPQLMRVVRPETADGKAVPLPTPKPLVHVLNVKPAMPVAASETSPPPAATPTPPVLQPFIAPTPAPASISATTGANWPVYDPGQMPRGKLVKLPDMPALAQTGVSGERLYLQGDFMVTAAGQNRAVLRANSALADALPFGTHASNTRVIVEFPPGEKPPDEGSTFSRDTRRPFQIMDVRKSSDGQVNVYVREVTTGQ